MLAALKRIGWRYARQEGSHEVLSRPGYPEYTWAFHAGVEIGPVMMARKYILEVIGLMLGKAAAKSAVLVDEVRLPWRYHRQVKSINKRHADALAAAKRLTKALADCGLKQRDLAQLLPSR